MIFDITKSAFDARASLEMLCIFLFAYEGRHQVYIDEPARDNFLEWIGKQDLITKEQIELGLDASLEEATSSEPNLRVLVTDPKYQDLAACPPRLSPSNAYAIGKQRLRILVENIESDRTFLLSMIPDTHEFARKFLSNAEWTEFYNGGGSTLPLVIESWKDNALLVMRSFCYFDSDAKEPGHPKQEAKAWAQLCTEVGLAHYCLARREIENYLPRQAMERYWSLAHPKPERLRRKGMVYPWARMSAVQRHHFDMKEGFKGSHSPGLGYDLLPPVVHTALKNGFGSKIWEEFYDIDSDWTDSDGSRVEIIQLVSEILAVR